MASQGAKSVISNDMQELTQGKEDISNQIRGHKAALSNPNTSEEAKANSKRAIEELGGDQNMVSTDNDIRSKNAAEKLSGSRVTKS
ncbi:hypothetical protein LZ30DRAFT_594415 [Colletotrichum cereale]|nr:hypothetical protein LZ30DRAFT_594415 [Colletotrichum cereale]